MGQLYDPFHSVCPFFHLTSHQPDFQPQSLSLQFFQSLVHVSPSLIPVFFPLPRSLSAHPQSSESFSLSWLYIPSRSQVPVVSTDTTFLYTLACSCRLTFNATLPLLPSSPTSPYILFQSLFALLLFLHSKTTPQPSTGRVHHQYSVTCQCYSLQTTETYCGK